MTKNIVDWKVDEKKFISERGNLSDMVEQNLVIADVEIRTSERYGEYVVVIDDEGNEYYTFSKIIRTQYEKIVNLTKEGKRIKVGVKINNRRQVFFGNPLD